METGVNVQVLYMTHCGTSPVTTVERRRASPLRRSVVCVDCVVGAVAGRYPQPGTYLLAATVCMIMY